MTSSTAPLAALGIVAGSCTTLIDAVHDPVVITRWRRPGRERAYVQVEGRIVGFRDLYTGVAECSVVTHLDLLMDVTDELVHLGAVCPAA